MLSYVKGQHQKSVWCCLVKTFLIYMILSVIMLSVMVGAVQGGKIKVENAPVFSAVIAFASVMMSLLIGVKKESDMITFVLAGGGILLVNVVLGILINGNCSVVSLIVWLFACTTTFFAQKIPRKGNRKRRRRR